MRPSNAIRATTHLAPHDGEPPRFGYTWRMLHMLQNAIVQACLIALIAQAALGSAPTSAVGGVAAESAIASENFVPKSETVTFNRKTHKYHCVTCAWAIRCTKSCVDVPTSAAVKAGGVPCKVCRGTCRDPGDLDSSGGHQ